MRVNLHDFSGHPFQVELSRELAARGHEVLHGFSTQYVTGHGRLTVTAEDPPSLRIEGISCPAPMVKYAAAQRARFEWSYANRWQAALTGENFDVVVACNVPMFALDRMRRYFAEKRQPWILWHQDLYSLGVGAEVGRRAPARLAARSRALIERIEAAQVRDADAVVAITDAMTRQYERWNVSSDHVHVIPNWAPLGDIVPRPRESAWARKQDLPRHAVRLMYAGTLGRKHNPLLLLELLDGCRARGIDAALVVVSEGDGARDLAAAAGDRSDVRIIGFQPAEVLSDVLGSADVVVALLEPDAAEYSVPSKVLSYLSGGCAVAALMPDSNPAARDVAATGGFVGPPSSSGADRAAAWLAATLSCGDGLVAIGERARRLACERFEIGRITDQFEQLFASVRGLEAVQPAPDRRRTPVLAARMPYSARADKQARRWP